MYFDKANKDKIFAKKNKFIDLSNCAGSIMLGHNHKYFNQSLKDYIKKN